MRGRNRISVIRVRDRAVQASGDSLRRASSRSQFGSPIAPEDSTAAGDDN
jgi:hypothetical protein